MRNFLISALDKLIAVVVVLMMLAVIGGAIAIMFTPAQPGQPPGFILGILALIFGTLYVVFVGGFMYLGLGIYHNTRRMAELMESRGT